MDAFRSIKINNTMSKKKLINKLVEDLKGMRASAELGQSELGKKLKTSRQTVCNIECGRYVPSVEMVYDIAEACGQELVISFKAK